MPKLIQEFKIVMTGDIYPTTFAAGDDVSGDIAAKAKAAGAIGKESPKRKAMKAPENK